MRPLCIIRAVQLSGQRRRCSFFPVTIPTAAARRRRQQFGTGSTTKSDTGRPPRRHIGNLAREDHKSCAILTAVQNTTLLLPVK